jgi:hypothetical protein
MKTKQIKPYPKPTRTGRKPINILDKKIQLTVYVELRKVNDFGGIEKAKESIIKLFNKPVKK